MLSVEEAREKLVAAARPISRVEQLAVPDALNRVLSLAVRAEVDVPPADNSAMDGYAFRYLDAEAAGFQLPVSQRIAAGRAPEPLAPGTAARIFTGGEVPAGADTVAMQENCRQQNNDVALDPEVKTGANIRPRGQDIASGDCLLPAGTRLRPQDMGLLSSVGRAQVQVYEPLKVAVFSTGDELVEPGRALKPGEIYNSNRATLAGLIRALGMAPVDLGNARDDRQATEAMLEKAAQLGDVVVSSGGVSVGDEDHVKAAVASMGELGFWKTAIKPGKPLAFGSLAGKPFMGLPGNPASVLVVGLVLLRPFLLAMQGALDAAPLGFQVPALFDRKGGTREEYLRGRLTGEGVDIFPNQSSGVLTSASRGNGLVRQAPGQVISAGAMVMFYPYSSYFGAAPGVGA